ncbi:hypothetical protein TIFTF001_007715 [Ficus carica]|uniref:Uncharacterized protein n=1 Tax=Ficus carica TaxID=3494 RepID=A0AA87ZRQ6_FICCA|nr:hypothetical protein TIFTF001_007715 [Ficus carica]
MTARRLDPSCHRSFVTRRSARLAKSTVGCSFLALSLSPRPPAARSRSAATPTTEGLGAQ